MNVALEFELGVTGGEEDGVDNTDVDSSRLYTQPEEVWYAYQVSQWMLSTAHSMQYGILSRRALASRTPYAKSKSAMSIRWDKSCPS